jgi:hypothetical protein
LIRSAKGAGRPLHFYGTGGILSLNASKIADMFWEAKRNLRKASVKLM